MEVKQLLSDEGAVSPVIGVILMVAITVILAAVIGTFVLGLGGNVNSTPQATFSFEFTGDASTGANTGDYVNITHDGGDTLQGSNVEVIANGNSLWDGGSYGSDVGAGDGADNWGSGDITAGQGITIGEDNEGTTDVFNGGDTVRVTWSSPNSDNTATLTSAEIGF